VYKKTSKFLCGPKSEVNTMNVGNIKILKSLLARATVLQQIIAAYASFCRRFAATTTPTAASPDVVVENMELVVLSFFFF